MANTFWDNVLDPFIPSTGLLPTPASNSNHPLLTNRRPETTKFPDPLPFCVLRLPLIVTVSLVVIGHSIDWEILIEDTSTDGKKLSLERDEEIH